jgi:hypothetical protein
MESSDVSNKNFFSYVFNFDNDSKSEMLNILQYSIIAIIPIVVLNKLMSKYIPEADDGKSSVEISAEIIIQVVSIFIGLFFIHRIITYIPTYSGAKYPEFSIIFIIGSILLITLSLQTKLGEKVNILVERIVDLWEGTTNTNSKNKKKKNGNKQTQGQGQGQTPNQAAITQSLYTDGTSINSLPTSDVQMPSTSGLTSQQTPNYNNMYRQDTTPMVNAATPGGMESFEPMAANSVLGGGSFGSW